MRSFLKNRNGSTLLEVIISMLLLAIATVPISATFLNAMFTTKLGGEQLEISSVIRVVKENVADAAKYDSIVFNNYDASGNQIKLKILNPDDIIENLKVYDHVDNTPYPDYQFDVIYRGPVLKPDGSSSGCNKFEIILKKQEASVFKETRKFNIEVNSLKDGTELEIP